MEGELQKGRQQGKGDCPLLLDLIPNKLDLMTRDGSGGRKGYGVAEEKQLELRLGPPGEEDWSTVKGRREDPSALSLGLFPKPSAGAKRGFLDTLESKPEVYQQQKGGFLHYQGSVGLGKEMAHKGEGRKVEQQQQRQLVHEKKASAATGNAAAANNSSQTRRTSPTPVVGWPPIRSFRKNITANSSKPPSSSSQADAPEKAQGPEDGTKSMLVKINMDGVPIGRKVDLNTYSSYERLSTAVDKLFRGLLAAQRETPTDSEESLEITGLLDGSGEYTLVYEDNEGDRMLVGDVPWDMFVSTVKRLRVLKSSELPSLSLGIASKERNTTRV